MLKWDREMVVILAGLEKATFVVVAFPLLGLVLFAGDGIYAFRCTIGDNGNITI